MGDINLDLETTEPEVYKEVVKGSMRRVVEQLTTTRNEARSRDRY